MGVKWKCDCCGKETHINPPHKQVFDKAGNPKIIKVKVQNQYTGEIEQQDQPEFEDLEPRAYIVRLNCGSESIQKDFCKECLKKIMPEVKALYNKLESIKSR